ncbi:Cysteine protease ATG4 [Sesamum alatum]|uniref:Cysteine protease n=1 Tax=Sesamum alatum TaxID=300844 RepID=A0AAE2CC25_9LAMI|nr:Cysteine protease ATG4 [Sesamum alatum]
MKGFLGRGSDPICSSCKKDSTCNYNQEKCLGSVSSEAGPSVSSSKNQKSVIWWGIRSPGLSIFENLNKNCEKSESRNCSNSRSTRKKSASGKNYYEAWRAAVRRVMMNGGTMRRILGFNRAGVSVSKSDIWLLGVCYRVAQEGDDANSLDPMQSEGFAAFIEDFSSRILFTYRKGFAPIGDTKYTSDVYWGCMLRSSQMLVAQAFLFHKLGRSWRKSPDKPLDGSYLEILHLFGDDEDSPCSIHNLLQGGNAYGLAPGSWVGPYAMCRTWESLVRNKREQIGDGILSSMIAVYVVSGDEDGERGGAPVLCIEDISRLCSKSSGGQSDWAPILLMVPLVLGLEKINPRYLPLLSATFTFPQSLGLLGGKPGASTYIVGVQDEKAFYLDPHDVQQVAHIKTDDLEADTSSYHCNVVRHMPLESIDSSLAIGFYCRNKSDFDDFCSRASELIDQSNGAPLFTIAESRSNPNPASYRSTANDDAICTQDFDPVDKLPTGGSENFAQDDEWQLL